MIRSEQVRAGAGVAARIAILMVVLQVAFTGLLLLAAGVPDRVVVRQLAEDVRTGAYGRDGAPDGMGGRSTSFTDCVEAGVYLGGHPDLGLLEKAIRAPRLDSCRNGAGEVLGLREGVLPPRDEYFRYWNGYTVLSRPVLALGGMNALRMVSGVLLTCSLIGCVLVLAGVTGRAYALALLGPVVVSTNLMAAPATSFSHSLSNATLLVAVAAAGWAAGRRPTWTPYVVTAGAASFCFMDLLTTPAVAWAWTAAVVAAATWTRGRQLRATTSAMLGAGFWWPVAFTITWVSRWLIAVPVAGFAEVRRNVTAKVDERLGDTSTVSDVFGAAVPLNARTWLQLATAPATLALAIGVGVLAVVLARRRRVSWALPAVLAFPALVVPGWLILLSNHSQVHDHFVYRTVPAALGVVLGAVVLAASRISHRGSGWLPSGLDN